MHEIRNPLTTVLMGLKAFQRLELPPRFQEYLSLSLEEGDRLQRLLNQILLYAKPQTLQQEELRLTQWITETLSTLQGTPIAANKPLIFQLPSAEFRVFADKDKLKQVLINLITNACEAVSDNSSVSLNVKRANHNQICIQIHNDGDPIPETVLPQLTKPFVTTKSNGNGLGLAIVKRIVEAHGGHLQIESSATMGTNVSVLLPCYE